MCICGQHTHVGYTSYRMVYVVVLGYSVIISRRNYVVIGTLLP